MWNRCSCDRAASLTVYYHPEVVVHLTSQSIDGKHISYALLSHLGIIWFHPPCLFICSLIQNINTFYWVSGVHRGLLIKVWFRLGRWVCVCKREREGDGADRDGTADCSTGCTSSPQAFCFLLCCHGAAYKRGQATLLQEAINNWLASGLISPEAAWQFHS